MKVLDFGLAKAFAGDEAEASVSNSPTLSTAATQQGMILGTAAYMSPEQAKGRTVDKRTDVWAFGCVLYEMLTGRQSFGASDVSESLAAVISLQPKWETLPENLHPRLRETVERCLEKPVAKRFQDIGDVKVDIEKVLADPTGLLVQPVAEVVRAKPQSKLPWVAAVLLVGIITGVVTWNLRAPEPPSVIRSASVLPDGQGFRRTARPVLTFSSDGSEFVYNATGGLYLRSIDELESRLVSGTEEELDSPTFSPDGEWLAYWSVLDGQLKKIPTVGGAPVSLAEITARPLGISWDADETILYGTAEGIMRVSADGGEPEVVTAGVGFQPQLLAGENAVLFTTAGGVEVYSLDSDERKELFPGVGARYVSTGHIVYGQEGTLFAVPFDIGALEVAGGPVPLVQGVATARFAQYAVSDSGSLAYVLGQVAQDVPSGVLAYVGRDGEIERLSLPPDQYRNPQLSPNGDQLAVEIVGNDGRSAVWVYELSGNTQIRRLTRPQDGSNAYPIWAPDGESLTFASNRTGTWGIYRQPADGLAEAEQLTLSDGESMHRPASWSPDGDFLAFVNDLLPTGSNTASLWMLSVETGEVELFYDQPGTNDETPAFSPDGEWIAYSSFEGGIAGIYLEPFPRIPGVQYEIVKNGEIHPTWARDGGELFYAVSRASGRSPGVYRVEFQAEPNPAVTDQEIVVENYLYQPRNANFDVTPDGEKVLVVLRADQASSVEPARPQINFVFNWFEELKERVPVP